MKRYVIIILFILVLPNWTHGVVPEFVIPSYATAFGYTKVLFSDIFKSLGTVDTTQSNGAGFNWYTNNGPKYGSGWCSTPCDPGQVAWFSAAGSILTVSTNGNQGGAELMSFGYKGISNIVRTVPLIDGSKGFYIEARMQFSTAAIAGLVPDFWVQDINGTINQIENSGSTRFCEIDILEAQTSNQISQGMIDWTDWHTKGDNPSNTVYATDLTVYHTWGVLMVPMALNGGTGFIRWYLDGVYGGFQVTWTNTSQAGGSSESAMFEINFAAGTSVPLNVDYIYVAVPP